MFDKPTLIALLCCRIQIYRIIHFVICGKRNFRIAPVIGMAASFEDIVKSIQIRTDINIRICNAVSYSSLRSQIHHNFRFINLEKNIEHRFI